MPLETPDVTKTQIIALVQPFVTGILGLLVAFNVDMTPDQKTAIITMTGIVAAAISIILGLGDAIIRNGRSKMVAAQALAAGPVSTPFDESPVDVQVGQDGDDAKVPLKP